MAKTILQTIIFYTLNQQIEKSIILSSANLRISILMSSSTKATFNPAIAHKKKRKRCHETSYVWLLKANKILTISLLNLTAPNLIYTKEGDGASTSGFLQLIHSNLLLSNSIIVFSIRMLINSKTFVSFNGGRKRIFFSKPILIFLFLFSRKNSSTEKGEH